MDIECHKTKEELDDALIWKNTTAVILKYIDCLIYPQLIDATSYPWSWTGNKPPPKALSDLKQLSNKDHKI